MRLIEARYPDGLALGRASSLTLSHRTTEDKLVSIKEVKFWTEHSERSTLPSPAAVSTNHPPEWLDHLGRWGANRSEVHNGNQLARTALIQRNVGERSRSMKD